jgi:hypothetical protein
MEPEGSLPHSQAPATCPYPEPDQSSPCLPIPLFNPFYFLGKRMEIQIITKLKEFRSDAPICCFIAYIKVTKAGNIKSYLLYL